MIFRKLIKRESSAIVAIEANSTKEADRIFNEWCKEDYNLDKLNSTLSEKEKDIEGYLASFNNWEELNRSSVKCSDFIIEKKDKEPLFDLIIKYPTMDNYEEKWEGITMARLANRLGYMNISYILEPEYYTTGGSLINMAARRNAGISGIAVFKATRREDK